METGMALVKNKKELAGKLEINSQEMYPSHLPVQGYEEHDRKKRTTTWKDGRKSCVSKKESKFHVEQETFREKI